MNHPTRMMITCLLLGMCSNTSAQPSFFLKGSKSVSVVLGSGSAFNDDYYVFGLGAGYFPAKGLEIGFDAQRWFSGTPTITKLSPRINYVFTQSDRFKPYIGTFFRRTYTEGFEDRDSSGARAGIYLTNPGSYVGIGMIYENYLDCDESIFVSCDDTYPEVSIAVSF